MKPKSDFVLLVKAPKENEQDDKYVQVLQEANFRVKTLKSLDFNFINLQALNDKLEQPECYSGFVFTSPRCVEAVRLALGSNSLKKDWLTKDHYVVGEATHNAAYLALNLTCKGQQTGNADNLSEFIIKDLNPNGKPLLIPHGNLKSNTLSLNLNRGNVHQEEITVYESIKNTNVVSDFMELTSNFSDVPMFIVFFSPSAVQCFQELFDKVNAVSEKKLLCIGPSTEKELKKLNEKVEGVCEKPTAESLLVLIKSHC